jgi:uncharacterized membrane protein
MGSGDTPSIRELVARLERVERVVAWLAAERPPAPISISQAPPGPSQPEAELPGSSPEGRPQRAQPEEATEASLVGTWFARLGAVAVLIGAGFGFKYAIDRGLIGPVARVSLGIAVGLAFVGWGEWARRRDWPGYAQAVSGGGLGLLYLSIWAGLHLYGLFPPTVAFAMLTVVAAGGVMLALRHDSQALAALSVIGGFANPYLVGIELASAAALSGYVFLIDLGVLVLAGKRRWPVLDRLALVGTWSVAITALLSRGSETLASLTAFFAIFAVVPFMRIATGRRVVPADVSMIFSNALLYLGTGLVVLFLGELEHWQTWFALALAIAHVGMAALARGDRLLFPAMVGLAALSLGVAAMLELEGPWVGIAWSIEGVALVWAGSRAGSPSLRGAGAALVGFAALLTAGSEFGLGETYRPARLLLSAESLAMGIHVAALAATAALLSRPSASEWERAAAGASAIGANLAALAWLSFEAQAAFSRAAPRPGNEQALQFTYSAIWSIYAGALLAVGVIARNRGARLLGVALLAATMVKMVLVDLWLLETLFRTLAFIGLGGVLLASSLLYHRFRDLVLEGTLDAEQG